MEDVVSVPYPGERQPVQLPEPLLKTNENTSFRDQSLTQSRSVSCLVFVDFCRLTQQSDTNVPGQKYIRKETRCACLLALSRALLVLWLLPWATKHTYDSLWNGFTGLPVQNFARRGRSTTRLVKKLSVDHSDGRTHS